MHVCLVLQGIDFEFLQRLRSKNFASGRDQVECQSMSQILKHKALSAKAGVLGVQYGQW